MLGGGGEGGGSTSVKLFPIFYILYSKNRDFNSYFLIVTCPLSKNTVADNSRVEPTIFFMKKKYPFLLNFSLAIFMGIL